MYKKYRLHFTSETVRELTCTCTYIHVHAPDKMNYMYIRTEILCVCLFVCIKTERIGKNVKWYFFLNYNISERNSY